MRFSGSNSPEDQAEYLRANADALCDMRSETAILIFDHITRTPSYRSWALTGVVAGLFATDKIDGTWARRAAEILGTETTAEGAKKDERADKRLCHAIFAGIAVRETLNGNVAYGALIGGADGLMAARDHVVGQYRDRGIELGVDGKARSGGKAKLVVLGATATLAVSPLANRHSDHILGATGQVIASAAMLAGAAMSVHSGYDQIQYQCEQAALLPLPGNLTA